jgi:hypothetical protein
LPDRYERFVAEIDAEPRFRRAAGQVAELSEALAGYGIRRRSSTTTCTTGRSS